MSQYGVKYHNKVLNTNAIDFNQIFFQIPNKLGPYTKISSSYLGKHPIIIETPVVTCSTDITPSKNSNYDILHFNIDRSNKYHNDLLIR